MRSNTWPNHQAESLHEKLSSESFKVMDGKVIPVENELHYETRPAFTDSHDLQSERYFSGKREPNTDPSVIFRNKLWHERLMRALETGSIAENEISIIVGSSHLLGDGNFLELIERSGFHVENCTPGLARCKYPRELYGDHFYFGNAAEA